MTLRREPYLRSENLLQYALDEIARLKGTKTRTTDGRNLVILPPGSAPPGGGTVPAPVEAGPHVLYGSKHTNSLHVTAGAGLNADYEGGQVWIAGAFYTIAAGTLTLADDATNYVFVDSTGTVTSNTTGFPTESLPLAIVVTASGAITSVTDQRAYLSDQGIAQAHTLFGTQHTESLRVTDGGTDDLFFDDGNTAIGGTDRGEGDANESNATKVTLTGGVYTTISFYGNVSPTGTRHVNIGIYDDSAGAPGTLQATTGYVVIAGSASPSWNTIALTAPATLPAGTYHIAVLGDGGFSVVTHWYYDAGASGDSHEDNPDTVSDGLEATWSGGSSGSKALSAYISGTNTVPVAAYEAGQVWIGSTFYEIAAGTIDLTPDDTNYVFVRSSDGTVFANITGFPGDCVPMAVVTAVDENITDIADRRSYHLQFGSAYSDEQAQDAVGTILLDTTEIDFTYTDAAPTIEASIKANSVVVGRVHFTDTALLLGRSTAAAGAGEEISIGVGLDLSGGVLSATGGFTLPLVVGPADFGFENHLELEPASGDNRVGLTTGTTRFGIIVGDPAGANFEGISILHASGFVGILNNAPGSELDVTGLVMASAGFNARAQSAVKFYDVDNSNFIGLKADATRTTDLVYILPAADPTVDQVLIASDPVAGVVTLSWGTPSSGYTDEQAQDAVGTILLDTATINLTYDDGTPTISADVIQAALDHGSIGGLSDNDHPQYILSSIFTADGDIIYRDIDDVVKALPIGGANKVLTVTSGVPAWQDPTGGGGSPAIPVWHRNFMMMGA